LFVFDEACVMVNSFIVSEVVERENIVWGESRLMLMIVPG
jgi:hypothetical protein